MSRKGHELPIIPPWNSICIEVEAASHGGLTVRGEMDPKLALLFLFIGTVITLSRLGGAELRRDSRPSLGWRWRELVRPRRKF
jgi:hypothetical protein